METCPLKSDTVLTRYVNWETLGGEERTRVEQVLFTRDHHSDCHSSGLHIFVGDKEFSKAILNEAFKQIKRELPRFSTTYIDAIYEHTLSGPLKPSEFQNFVSSLGGSMRMEKNGVENFSDFLGKDDVHYIEDAECNDESCLLCYPDDSQSQADDFNVFPNGWAEVSLLWQDGTNEVNRWLSVNFLPLQGSNQYL